MRRQGQGVAAEIGLARRESPHRGAIHLGLAKLLTTEMPHTLVAMRAGVCSEWRAMLLARETAAVTAEDRRVVDAEIAGDPSRLARLGDKALIGSVRALVYRLDPEAPVRRAAKAASERYVSLRPAPDTMAWLSALLPVDQGVTAYAALVRTADRARAAGDDRSRGQVMADALVAGVTRMPDVAKTEGVSSAIGEAGVGAAGVGAVGRRNAGGSGSGGIGIQVVMTDRSLLAGDAEPAYLHGYGVVPAGWARAQVADALDRGTEVFVRRLHVAPASGALVGMDATGRRVPPGLARLIRARDRTCRTPWCDAPIRHIDHIVAHHDDGPTSATNGQGLCEACNYAKQARGWWHDVGTGPPRRHTVTVTTPTGHRYTSTAPPLPGCHDRHATAATTASA